MSTKVGKHLPYYHFVNNANKLFALFTAITIFFFYNLNFRTNRIINALASSTFGILLLHQNWIVPEYNWQHIFNNLNAFENYSCLNFLLHVMESVTIVYITSAIIDIFLRKILLVLKFLYVGKNNG